MRERIVRWGRGSKAGKPEEERKEKKERSRATFQYVTSNGRYIKFS